MSTFSIAGNERPDAATLVNHCDHSSENLASDKCKVVKSNGDFKKWYLCDGNEYTITFNPGVCMLDSRNILGR